MKLCGSKAVFRMKSQSPAGRAAGLHLLPLSLDELLSREPVDLEKLSADGVSKAEKPGFSLDHLGFTPGCTGCTPKSGGGGLVFDISMDEMGVKTKTEILHLTQWVNGVLSFLDFNLRKSASICGQSDFFRLNKGGKKRISFFRLLPTPHHLRGKQSVFP